MRRILLGLALLVPAVAAQAGADAWICDYDGSWQSNDGSERGSFNWRVVWEETRRGWRITGDYEDDYGASTLDGNCDSRECKFTQHYRSGSLSGQTYHWRGRYSDHGSTPDRTINQFRGTWGANQIANDGSWTAIASCRRT